MVVRMIVSYCVRGTKRVVVRLAGANYMGDDPTWGIYLRPEIIYHISAVVGPIFFFAARGDSAM